MTDYNDDDIDVTILYCQGCGSCKPDDGSTCPPTCRVQLFPREGHRPVDYCEGDDTYGKRMGLE